jgi:uncharacterized protein YndB with AHSA1/START domain
MNIAKDAPLKAHKKIVIIVPIEKVWSLLTEINLWTRWQLDVTSVRKDGDLSVGTIFRI